MSITLTPEQIEFYDENGYLVLEGVLNAEKLAELRRETEAIIARAATVRENDAIYDLEDSHSPENPRVRRIKNPYEHSGYFRRLCADPDIVEPLVGLLGPDIRLYGGKMNMKSAGYGAPVEWHQDWAFYPHTNDDVLATGILLDDCDESNGPLLVMPGSHKGPTYDHHNAEGYFCGAMDPEKVDLDFSRAVALTAPAGSMTIHHVRMVHGSAMNTSNRQRRLLLWEYTASDAWPLLGPKGDWADHEAQMVRGRSSPVPRLREAPVRLPLPPAPHQGSIYENQRDTGSRFFETYEERAQVAVI